MISGDEPTKSSDNNCCFCIEYSSPKKSEFHLKVGKRLGISTRIVAESENWFVIPSLGCLAVGHMLLIPKVHTLSIANLDTAMFGEMLDLKQGVAKRLLEYTGKECVCFEHGITTQSAVGANSVNHLHLHMVPSDKELWPLIDRQSGRSESTCFSNFQTLYNHLKQHMPLSYLLFQDTDQSIHYISDASSYPSQFFRIQVAKYMGIPEWDWKRDYNEASVIRTLRFFQSASHT